MIVFLGLAFEAKHVVNSLFSQDFFRPFGRAVTCERFNLAECNRINLRSIRKHSNIEHASWTWQTPPQRPLRKLLTAAITDYSQEEKVRADNLL